MAHEKIFSILVQAESSYFESETEEWINWFRDQRVYQRPASYVDLARILIECESQNNKAYFPNLLPQQFLVTMLNLKEGVPSQPYVCPSVHLLTYHSAYPSHCAFADRPSNAGVEYLLFFQYL